MKSHAAAAVELLKAEGEPAAREIVDAITIDLETAPVSDRDRALYRAVREMTLGRVQLEQSTFDSLFALGWSENAAFEALNVCALFHFFNVWVDGSGAGLLTEGCSDAGSRIAADGYSRG
jgi:hypothetical protein